MAPHVRSSNRAWLLRLLLVMLVFGAALAGGLVARLVPLVDTPPDAGGPAAPVLPSGQLTLSPLVRRTAPAVVNIAVLQPSPVLQNPLLRDPFFRRYFGVPDSALQPASPPARG